VREPGRAFEVPQASLKRVDLVSLVSVNVGLPSVIGSYRGRPLTSAIGKQPVATDSLYLDQRMAGRTRPSTPTRSSTSGPGRQSWVRTLDQPHSART
jgi:hypothetical protein